MKKVHRLGTLQFCMDLKWEATMYIKTQQLLDDKVSKKELLNTIATEFNISTREVHKRLRSMFGKSLDELMTPSKQELTLAILQADCIQELKSILKKEQGLSKLYDKYYSVSTFAAAKIKCESYREVTPYNPTKDDNLSILIAQSLGDGSLEFNGDKPRYSISIAHCEKQFEYLVEKVKLINKAYPTSPAVGTIRKYKHSQGHVYFQYRTNKMDNSEMNYIYNTPKAALVKEMTPLGIYLLFMDDGSLVQNSNSKKLTICNRYPDVRVALKEYLSSYGIETNIYSNDMVVCMSNVVAITKFLNNFVIPFKQYIPECMEYKTKLMV